MYFTELNNNSKKNVIRVVLDQPRLFIEESLGSVMVRGEVVINFTRDIAIQGPIELVFEGIQRIYTWQEMMSPRVVLDPIESKFQITELSLLPPNSQGTMPAGIQRFPFEFPIPASLPASIYIKDRIKIFYKVTATLRRSHQEHATNLIDWIEQAYLTKRKYVHWEKLHIVNPIYPTRAELQNDWLELYQGFDGQYDQFSASMAGKTSSNTVNNVRYTMAVDRTAIVIGTSVEIEVMVEPIAINTRIRSILLKITEKQEYAIKIPRDNCRASPETHHSQESVKMILKWGYTQNKDPPQHADHPKKDISKEELVNLKEFNQQVKLGETFHRKFRMPIPDCSNILHPSINHDTVKLSHWLQLETLLESEGQVFTVYIESPMQMLDCSLVTADDAYQTMLPPPPQYKSDQFTHKYPASTFLEQRELITSTSGWGNHLPCPCVQKRLASEKSNPLPERGPPPCYSS